MPFIHIHPQSSGNPPESKRKSPVAALFRRTSAPPPYTLTEQNVTQPSIDSGAATQVNAQVHHASFFPTVPSDTVHHQYNLKSRGRDYALLTVASHARNVQDSPLLYFGEELKGFVALSRNDLDDLQSVDVVLQMFDLDPTLTSYEGKCKLLPPPVDNSHISNDQFCWPFSVPSPTTSVPPSSASSQVDSSLGHQSSNGYNTGSDQNFQLIVTIHRRGYLNSNVEMCQNIHFIHPPDLSTRSSPSPVSVNLPQAPPALVSLPQDPPAVLLWEEKEFPLVISRGVMFGQTLVEVECKLVTPVSYPVGDIIPLHLTLTSENRVALDLLAVSHLIDVQLHKVMGFGEQATTVRPLSLWKRGAFHRSDFAAKAHWQRDGQTMELPPDDEHRQTRWRVKLNGNLERETNIELTPSFDDSGMAYVYFVSLFPFRSKDFRPASDPKKALVMGKIQLTAPSHSQS